MFFWLFLYLRFKSDICSFYYQFLFLGFSRDIFFNDVSVCFCQINNWINSFSICQLFINNTFLWFSQKNELIRRLENVIIRLYFIVVVLLLTFTNSVIFSYLLHLRSYSFLIFMFLIYWFDLKLCRFIKQFLFFNFFAII